MKIQVPLNDLVQVSNVELQDGDTLLKNKSLLCFDPVQNPSFDFVAGKWDSVVGSHLDKRYAAIRKREDANRGIPEGILLSSRADFNWFHWLIETLPRLMVADDYLPAEIPLVISESIPSAARESISAVTNRVCVEISRKTRQRFESLWVLGPVLFHPDTPHLWMGEKFVLVNEAPLRELRNRVLEHNRVKRPIVQPERVFIPRASNHRSLVNRSKISALLEGLQFQTVHIEKLSFLSQAELFNQAKIIVFEGGATMSNLIFCSAGAQVIVLAGKSLGNYKMPVILGEIAGASVKVLTGREIRPLHAKSFSSRMHSSYKVSARELKSALGEITIPHSA
jgi:capsular polysaccharide biosynthesis protein